MKQKITMKFLMVFFTILLAGMFCSAFGSDYKYKILDPTYNTSIEGYEYDEENSVLVEKEPPGERHPLRKAALVLFLIGVPVIAVYRIFRVLKKVDCADDSQDFDFVREVFAVDKLKEVNKGIKNTACYMRDKLYIVKKPADNNKINQRLQSVTVQKPIETPGVTKPANTQVMLKNRPLDRFETATMDKMQNPLLINSSKLANNKGLCLVQYQDEFSLIGYIDDEIFVLNKFDSLASNEIRSRHSESLDSGDRYIVKLGNYKALVEVNDKNMELLLEL